MHTTTLRRVGGSVMLALPPALLDLLRLGAGASVGLTMEGERLVVQPRPTPRYTLDELLDASDPGGAREGDEEAWLGGPAVGRELI